MRIGPFGSSSTATQVPPAEGVRTLPTEGARARPAGPVRALPAVLPRSPSWQSTLMGLFLLGGVMGTFLTLAVLDGIDAGLMAWSALGPLVGIVTGAMTTYFFAGANAAAERSERLHTHERLAREQEARLAAETRMHLLMGLGGTEMLATAARMSPHLFTPPPADPAVENRPA